MEKYAVKVLRKRKRQASEKQLLILLNLTQLEKTLNSLQIKESIYWSIFGQAGGPCRVENPRLVKLFNHYKDKGFDILGVSLDGNSEAWQKLLKPIT